MPASAIEFRETVRSFSDELVALQQPIRILDAIAWGDDVASDFFAAGCDRQPDVDAEYYATRRPLRFEPDDVRAGFTDLRVRISRRLGGAPIEGLLVGRIDEYLRVIDLLEAVARRRSAGSRPSCTAGSTTSCIRTDRPWRTSAH